MYKTFFFSRPPPLFPQNPPSPPPPPIIHDLPPVSVTTDFASQHPLPYDRCSAEFGKSHRKRKLNPTMPFRTSLWIVQQSHAVSVKLNASPPSTPLGACLAKMNARMHVLPYMLPQRKLHYFHTPQNLEASVKPHSRFPVRSSMTVCTIVFQVSRGLSPNFLLISSLRPGPRLIRHMFLFMSVYTVICFTCRGSAFL